MPTTGAIIKLSLKDFKMKNIHLAIIFSFFICAACSVEHEQTDSETIVLHSFVLKAEDNPSLSEDFIFPIGEGTSVSAFCHELEDVTSVVPSFSGNFARAYVDGSLQISGESSVDFTNAVYYQFENDEGKTLTYRFSLVCGNGLPIMEIDTVDEPILNKEDYVTAQFVIRNMNEAGEFHMPGKIRLRGNATSGYPKKPYKIKFDSKVSPFGFPENKDWALLAEYSDKSLLRNTWMVEISRAAELEYTIHYHPLEVWLNGKYIGVYTLTDHVEKKKNRVQLDDDGFFIQNDNAYQDEPLSFLTSLHKYRWTFKYPDPDDGEIAEGDDNFNFIVKYLNDFEAALASEDFKDPETGYRAYIEPVSFAKWYIAAEASHNYEPNIYYVLKNRNDKLRMFPIWDGEWSMGLAYRPEAVGSWVRYPDGEPKPDDIFWSRGKYFKKLFEDQYFTAIVKEEWKKFKPQVEAIKSRMREAADRLKYAQTDNFERWDILNSDTHIGVGLIAFDTWEEEVEYTFDIFDTRISTMNNFISSLP